MGEHQCQELETSRSMLTADALAAHDEEVGQISAEEAFWIGVPKILLGDLSQTELPRLDFSPSAREAVLCGTQTSRTRLARQDVEVPEAEGTGHDPMLDERCVATCEGKPFALLDVTSIEPRRFDQLDDALATSEARAGVPELEEALRMEYQDVTSETLLEVVLFKIAQAAVRNCSGCGAVGAKLKCSRCGLAFYCGRECQKTHWKRAHKKECGKAQLSEAEQTEIAAAEMEQLQSAVDEMKARIGSMGDGPEKDEQQLEMAELDCKLAALASGDFQIRREKL